MVLYTEKQNNITKTMYFECYSHCQLSKRQNAWKATYMEKRNDIIRNVCFGCFSNVLGTKTLKSMKTTIYGNRK